MHLRLGIWAWSVVAQYIRHQKASQAITVAKHVVLVQSAAGLSLDYHIIDV